MHTLCFFDVFWQATRTDSGMASSSVRVSLLFCVEAEGVAEESCAGCVSCAGVLSMLLRGSSAIGAACLFEKSGTSTSSSLSFIHMMDKISRGVGEQRMQAQYLGGPFKDFQTTFYLQTIRILLQKLMVGMQEVMVFLLLWLHFS